MKAILVPVLVLAAMLLAASPASAANTFSATGSLAAARSNHSSTLLPNGKLLLAGGYRYGGYLASAELYDPATGMWSATGSLATARSHHTATLLPNGKLLVAGGYDGGASLASAELYDPATGTWSATGSLATARGQHTATLLPNGKVLFAAGADGSSGNPLASAELYDPATGTWSATDSLATARYGQTATVLQNGKVLVTAGYGSGNPLASAELYDPATGMWSGTGSLATAFSFHTATLLPTGKVLVAGGFYGGFLASAGLYDPATGTWSDTGSLATARGHHTATLLPNGKVLVAGGYNAGSDYLASAELYDPATGTWSATGPLATSRYNHTASLLPNGKVLVVAGFNDSGFLATAELYDSATGSWSATGSQAAGRYLHTATLLPTGKVLVTGGVDGISHLASAELYDPATGTWSATGSLATARGYHTATLLPLGKVLVAGGDDSRGSSVASAELYDPATGTWSATGSPVSARCRHTATLLPNGMVLVAGGYDGSGYVASGDLYDPATGTWSPTAPLATARAAHTATLLPNGKVLVAGGFNDGGALTSAELYDPTTGTWSATGSFASARFDHTATLLPNGRVLVPEDGGPSNAEFFDPATGTWGATAPLAAVRLNHTATLLANGQVVVAGGIIGSPTGVELYDPATGTWSTTGSLASARYYHTATLLPNGKVLIAGGYNNISALASAELYDVGLGFSPAAQPEITTVAINGNAALVLAGTNFTGISSASGGNGSQDSPSNHPVVQVRRLDNEQSTFLRSDPNTNTSATAFTSVTMIGLADGHYAVTAFTNGIPSAAAIVAFIAPVTQVSSNSLFIANADSTPAVADGTDFGNMALLNATVGHTFTILNGGTVALTLSGSPRIAISGAAAADFAVIAQPVSPVAAAGSTTFAITFAPRSPGPRTALVSLANSDPNANPYTFAISGVGTLAVKLTQTITFAPPATLYLGQSPFPLSAFSSSALPVSYRVVSGPAIINGNALTFVGTGYVQVESTQAGDLYYKAATPVVKTILVKADPTTLTLINLVQTYDGSPKPIGTLGGGAATIGYKVGTTYGLIAPTAVGSYAVSAVAGGVAKTGTLVIAKAPLFVAPDYQRKFAGRVNPVLTCHITGYQGTDDASVLTKAPVLATKATLASTGGLFPITASGAAALNYSFIYQQGTMVVESFAGSYEALLVDGSSQPVGKLSVTVAANATNSFTGKLYTSTETAPLPLTGSLGTDTVNERASGTVYTITRVGIPHVTNFILPLHGNVSASVTRDNLPLGSATDGQKLSTTAVLYGGEHTAVLEPATPAGVGVPVGAGWATASIGTTGVMTLSGKLGDGTAFTTTLSPDGLSDPGYRVFVQPYLAARTESFLAGAFSLEPHPTLANRRYVAATGMTWKKAGLPADASYRSGFGPVTTVLMLDPWLPPAAATKTLPAITLLQRLGLTVPNFAVSHSDTGSASNGSLPARVVLSATNAVSVQTPAVNLTKWKTLTFLTSNGTFTGSFELSDVVSGKEVKRPVTFSGLLRQPATAMDTLIGDGHYLLPPLSGTEKGTGEVNFQRP